MPFSIAQGHQFYLLSSEAFLLTVLLKEKAIANNKIKKEAVGQSGRAAGSLALRDGSDRPDLIFWLLLDQAKSDKPPR
jgi:hypothetical protein